MKVHRAGAFSGFRGIKKSGRYPLRCRQGASFTRFTLLGKAGIHFTSGYTEENRVKKLFQGAIVGLSTTGIRTTVKTHDGPVAQKPEPVGHRVHKNKDRLIKLWNE